MCGCYYCRDGGFYKLCMRIDAEYKWNAIAYFPTNENVRAYKDLMPILGDDPYFLYNYAVALYGKGCLEESLNVALQCRTYWADYDLELLLGDIYLDKMNISRLRVTIEKLHLCVLPGLLHYIKSILCIEE